MNAVPFQKRDGKVVLALVLFSSHKGTLLFRPPAAEEQPGELVLAQDPDTDGFFQEMSSPRLEIKVHELRSLLVNLSQFLSDSDQSNET